MCVLRRDQLNGTLFSDAGSNPKAIAGWRLYQDRVLKGVPEGEKTLSPPRVTVAALVERPRVSHASLVSCGTSIAEQRLQVFLPFPEGDKRRSKVTRVEDTQPEDTDAHGQRQCTSVARITPGEPRTRRGKTLLPIRLRRLRDDCPGSDSAILCHADVPYPTAPHPSSSSPTKAAPFAVSCGRDEEHFTFIHNFTTLIPAKTPACVYLPPWCLCVLVLYLQLPPVPAESLPCPCLTCTCRFSAPYLASCRSDWHSLRGDAARPPDPLRRRDCRADGSFDPCVLSAEELATLMQTRPPISAIDWALCGPRWTVHSSSKL
ncbi:hypothetical protein E2C01_050823 [Portunus trituberculatus]|uniref:Uncharacterized protein n=1 Tax=Portunus trituberculatus TaxID=210409 RepID=A0A5B7GHY6_PORTR|nr:hypothetical protein [Portunus trituberculatus]